MAIDIDDIITEHGAYYKDSGQNVKRLLSTLYEGSVTSEEFITIPTNQTVEDFGNAAVTRVLQPFQKAFTPLGDLTVTPVRIHLFKMKVDQTITPDDIEKSWLGFLAEGGLDRKDWPLIRYMLEAHITPKMYEDYELNEAYAGVAAAPTPGTAGAAGTSMDGIKKLIIDGDTNLITMGTIPTDDVDFVTYIEEYFGQIPAKYRKLFKKLYMKEDSELRFKRGMRRKYNMNYAQADLLTLADFPGVTVKGLPSMGTSNKIWTTMPQNMIRFVKKADNKKGYKVESAKREVAVFTDFWDGLGFPYPQHVFTNDQDNS